MVSKTLFFTSLLAALDVVAGLSLRGLDIPVEGEVYGYSIPEGLRVKRQFSTCPVGTRQCGETETQILCAAVCCFEDGKFVYGCRIGYSCWGSGADAGCCPVGRICSSGPPPCVDAGETAPSPTTACPSSLPSCTSNSLGAPICSGNINGGSDDTTTRSFTLTFTSTVGVTTTESETETSTSSEPESTTTEESTSTSFTTIVETVTSTSEIPEETTTDEPTTTTVVTTTAETTVFVPSPSANATFTPLPPATSGSGSKHPLSLFFGLLSVAFAFFLF